MAQIPFSTPPATEPGISRKVLGMAAAAVLLAIAVVALVTLRRPVPALNAELPVDAYAGALQIDNVQLSEATNGTGGKVTYIDGTITNTGRKVLTSATLQLAFRISGGGQMERRTAPLTLIRTREPYVDLEPASSEPVKPSTSHDFRLIVESPPADWDEKAPEIRVVKADVE